MLWEIVKKKIFLFSRSACGRGPPKKNKSLLLVACCLWFRAAAEAAARSVIFIQRYFFFKGLPVYSLIPDLSGVLALFKHKLPNRSGIRGGSSALDLNFTNYNRIRFLFLPSTFFYTTQ